MGQGKSRSIPEPARREQAGAGVVGGERNAVCSPRNPGKALPTVKNHLLHHQVFTEMQCGRAKLRNQPLNPALLLN